MTGAYDDILRLPHPTSERHPRMPISERAAQFSPFAALTGHGAATAETARLTERRIEPDEDEKAVLDLKQRRLAERARERPEVTVTWFRPDGRKDGGSYVTAAGQLKRIDDAGRRVILTDGTVIPMDDILDIESECLGGLSQADTELL